MDDMNEITKLTDKVGPVLDKDKLRLIIPALMSMIAGYIDEWSEAEAEALMSAPSMAVPDPQNSKEKALLLSRYEKIFDVIDFLLFTGTKQNYKDVRWILSALTEKYAGADTNDSGYMTNDSDPFDDDDPFGLNGKLDDFKLD